MTARIYGSVVAMEFKARPDIAFEDFVEEFDQAFQVVDSETSTLTWEHDDLAIVDRDYVRVAIGWLPSPGKGHPWHIIMAVGSAPGDTIAKVEPASYTFLTDRIVTRTGEFLPATAILRGEAHQPITPTLMDALGDLLCADAGPSSENTESGKSPAEVTREEDEECYADMVETMLPPWSYRSTYEIDRSDNATSLHHDMYHQADNTFSQRKSSLLQDASQTSDPMRLTIHTLALSIFLYVPPLGAALFAYTMMRDVIPAAAQTM